MSFAISSACATPPGRRERPSTKDDARLPRFLKRFLSARDKTSKKSSGPSHTIRAAEGKGRSPDPLPLAPVLLFLYVVSRFDVVIIEFIVVFKVFLVVGHFELVVLIL